MSGNQIRADFAVLDQLAADQGAHAGNIDEYRSTLVQHAARALGALDGGMGSEEHQICMRKVDQLVDEHIAATQAYRQSTGNANDLFRSGGQLARSILGSGA